MFLTWKGEIPEYKAVNIVISSCEMTEKYIFSDFWGSFKSYMLEKQCLDRRKVIAIRILFSKPEMCVCSNNNLSFFKVI